MSEYNDDSSRESDGDNDQSKGAADSDAIDELLRDPKKEGLVLAKLGLNDDPKDPVPTRKDSGKRDDSNDNSNQHLTLSGKSAGAWSMPPPFGGWWFPGPGWHRPHPGIRGVRRLVGHMRMRMEAFLLIQQTHVPVSQLEHRNVPGFWSRKIMIQMMNRVTL